MSTAIFLARHGKTAANLENRFAGRTGEELHQEGREQYALLAERLKKQGIGAIYSGPLARTRQSAEIISQATGAPLEISTAFNEIDLPHWDGLTKQQIADQFGSEYPTWLEAPDQFSISGCENLHQVQARAVNKIEEIFSVHKDMAIVVISHLIVVRCLLLHYSQRPISEFRKIKIDNASLTGLIRYESGSTRVVADL